MNAGEKTPQQMEEGRARLPSYLKVIIDYAEWVPEEYRELAQKETDVDYLKELLLAASDQVPAQKAEEAAKKGKNRDIALRAVRYQHIRDETGENYEKQWKEVKNKLTNLEKMAGALMERVDMIGVISRERFMDEPEEGAYPVCSPQGKIEENGESGTEGRDKETGQMRVIVVQEEKRKRGIFGRHEDTAGSLISRLLESGDYSENQIDYLLDAIEEGLPIERIRTFASPKFPVEVMERLRHMQERKESEE